MIGSVSGGMMGARRTIEAAADHHQLFQIGERAPLRRDAARELVVVATIIAQVEDLERHRQNLRQKSCARDSLLISFLRTVYLVVPYL